MEDVLHEVALIFKRLLHLYFRSIEGVWKNTLVDHLADLDNILNNFQLCAVNVSVVFLLFV